LLGIIQGLTEFTPVSSSAHLVAIPQILGWRDMGLSFDVALHWGTLAALVVYFRRDWAAILSSFARRRDDSESDVGGRMLVPIVVACVPAALAGILLDKRIEALREWPMLIPAIACVLIGVGLVMLLAEKVGKRQRKIDQMNRLDYAVIGIAQALALFPGVSRSGITISAGLFRGLDRPAAARFSFLLSTPIIFGAGLVKLKDLASTGLPYGQLAPFALGFLTSALSGYFAIVFLMSYLTKRPMNVFVAYRVVFAVALLLASQ
jgi:undecaprenyl-diphosphatase